MGPNVGRRTGQWLHTDLLAAVQLPDGAHHHMHGIKHQGSRQLSGGQGWGGTGKRQLSQRSLEPPAATPSPPTTLGCLSRGMHVAGRGVHAAKPLRQHLLLNAPDHVSVQGRARLRACLDSQLCHPQRGVCMTLRWGCAWESACLCRRCRQLDNGTAPLSVCLGTFMWVGLGKCSYLFIHRAGWGV